ncbi:MULTISPECIES: alpha/beta fold hydrolase [unclassified Pseudomonas]|uniref:alpha/beta fold hydrolase n=1 Tax=unclassified Pseudomonas TaxID=196821 RepID=UPI001BCD2E42|nr:alpha/beta hydrolase [Pseudomonas sp. Pc102]BBP83452.1 hydrolase [Pseudomonas sp. Pc102]
MLDFTTKVVQGEPVEVRPGRFLNLARRVVDKGAPSLFFAHGGGGNKDQWRLIWQDPRLARYNLVAWDLLGHGASETPRQASAYAWEELVADQLAIFERFASEQNVVLAHSFGTALTLSALVRLQERQQLNRVHGVLLLGTQLQSPRGSSPLLKLPAWVLELIRPLLSKGFRDAAWHPDTDPELIAYEEKLTERNRLHVFKALLSQTRWIPEEQLAQLSVPIRILSGEHDRLTPPEGGRALHHRLPGSGFAIIEGAAHQLMLERPEPVTEHLLALLREVIAVP